MEPKKTRRQLKNEQNMRSIIQHSRRLFSMRGFDAVTVDEICTAADIGKSTFYNLFDSKADLLMTAACEERNLYLKENFTLDDSVPFCEQLKSFFRINFAFNHHNGPERTRLEYKSYLLTGNTIPDSDQLYSEQLRHLICRGMREDVLKSTLTADEYYWLITDILIGLLIGWAVRAYGKSPLPEVCNETTLQTLISSLLR